MVRRFTSERGQALVETALTLPILLLVTVGIFEFGRAYQTWQVLTNAAREGARVAVLPNQPAGAAEARALAYVAAGNLSNGGDTTAAVEAIELSIGGGTTVGGSQVTLSYPFEFMVLQPVAQLITNGSLTGEPFTMSAAASMRNETQN